MAVRFWLVIAATLVAWLLPVALLTAGMLVGPDDLEAAREWARRFGEVMTLAGGPLATLGVAWVASRRTPSPAFHGLLIGLFCAALEAGVLYLASAPLVVALVAVGGRLLGGVVGGRLAARSLARTA